MSGLRSQTSRTGNQDHLKGHLKVLRPSFDLEGGGQGQI